MATGDRLASIDLYWLPLGAGGHCVRFNGTVYEWVASRWEHRPAQELYHSALVVTVDDVAWTVEMGPGWNVDAPDTAIVCTGSVGARWLGRLRAFQYVVRCWPGGYIPDIAEAVDGPVRMRDDHALALATLQTVRRVPGLTWGRDEEGTGDMWNSNSLISWTLAMSGHDLAGVHPPRGGRAPGWDAGRVLTERASMLSSVRCVSAAGPAPVG